MDNLPIYIKSDKGDYYLVNYQIDLEIEKLSVQRQIEELIPWRDTSIVTIEAQYQEKLATLQAILSELNKLG